MTAPRKVTSMRHLAARMRCNARRDDALIEELTAEGVACVSFFPCGGFSALQSSTVDDVAAQLDATPMQVALARLLPRSPNLLLIPGTSSVTHLRETLASATPALSEDKKGAAVVFVEGTFPERSIGSLRFTWTPDFSTRWIDRRNVSRLRDGRHTARDQILLVVTGARFRYSSRDDWSHLEHGPNTRRRSASVAATCRQRAEAQARILRTLVCGMSVTDARHARRVPLGVRLGL